MKIIITQPEIEQIIQNHINENFALRDGSSPTISFTATRGDNGITAEIDIPYVGVTSLDLDTKADAAAPKKAGKKNPFKKPQAESEKEPEPEQELAPAQEAEDDSPLGEETTEAAETEQTAPAETAAGKGKSLFDDTK